MPPEDVIDRLKAQLLTSGLSQKDNATFQVINQLIDAIRGLISGTITISGGGGGGGGLIASAPIVTWSDAAAILPNSRQIIPGDGIEFNTIAPPQRRLIVESQRRNSIINEIESQRGPLIPGPQGIQGLQGLTGPRGFDGSNDDLPALPVGLRATEGNLYEWGVSDEYTPTYSGSGAMTFTAVTTVTAAYLRVNKFLYLSLNIGPGTVGGVVAIDLRNTLPNGWVAKKTCLYNANGTDNAIFQPAVQVFTVAGSNILSWRKGPGTTWTASAVTFLQGTFLIELE